MGEYAVGAYLRLVEGCRLVSYDQKASEERGKGEEIDVVALHSTNRTVFLCEVATHLGGINYGGGNQDTLQRLRKKFTAFRRYASEAFPDLKPRFMLWSPYVPTGTLTEGLEKMRQDTDIEPIINQEYSKRVRMLQDKARTDIKDRGEPFYRALQILEHLR